LTLFHDEYQFGAILTCVNLVGGESADIKAWR
jgi:hypothetical protein